MSHADAGESVRSHSALPADLATAVSLGGEMGRRFAEFDWGSHPLGPPGDWSAELRAAVAVALTSRFPIVLWADAHELYLIYNDAYAQILGDKHPAALGLPGREAWWDIWESIGPMLSSVTATGRATWSNDLMLTFSIEGRPEERYFTFSYSPIIGPMGGVDGIFCAVTETTERVLGERRLHVLNTVAAAVMETHTIDDSVAKAVAACATQPADLPFIAVYVKDAESHDIVLRGATPSTLPLLPRSLTQLTDWTPTQARAPHEIDRLAAVMPGLDRVFADDCPQRALVLPLSEMSTAGALVIGINPRRPLDAQYRGFCQLLADQLSSALASAVAYELQRQRADALAELDRAKTAFLTNVSHEFRTPLTLLLGPLDDAVSEAGPDALLTDRLDMARRNARRLLRLVDALLDFSRIEAGRATATLECIDLGEMTSHIASSFTELCHRAGLELVLHCDSVLADVDAAMWETIILNLLSNAIKFTMRGSITVETRREADGPRVTVRDTGVGIAQEDLDRLFERFYRAENARARSVEGSGIGLSLVKGLVELQKGTVDITSELDSGTAVTIRLPRSSESVPIDRSSSRLAAQNPYVTEAAQWLVPMPASPTYAATETDERRRQLVLIADDNADMRSHLERVLSAQWDTVLVGDGKSALARARELRPDAIVTDVMMPGLDGFEFVAAVRADPTLSSTPILMLSARAGSEAVSEGFAGGADDYLPKPFSSQELVDRLSARLSAAARERASRIQREAERRRDSALLQLDSAFQATDSISGLLDALVDSPACSGGAIAIAIGVLDEAERNLRLEYGGVVPAELRDRYHVVALDAPLPVAHVVSTGEAMVIPDTFDTDARYRSVVQDAADSVRSTVIHPLRSSTGHVIGALVLMWAAPRSFEANDLEMCARTAEVTQSAVDRIGMAWREHQIAVDFQEHLLDLDRRSTAAAISAIYQPAGEAMRVGGDWYLVVPLDGSGRVVISVGDVVGHGLPAAIVMSKLRAAVAASALTTADPAAVLNALDRYAATIAGARCATVSYAVVDTEAATISYSCAGHPYPLLLAPDRPPSFLESGRRPPVAAWNSKSAGDAAQVKLPPGGVILFYTDGLLERLGEPLDQGFARLRDAAAQCANLPVAEVCTELLDRMAPPGGYIDDVVVLAVRPNHSTAGSFATVVPAAAAHVPALRGQLSRWLSTVSVDPRREYAILLGIGEAVANAIEHGSLSDPSNTVSIEVFRRYRTISATVSDSGRWLGDSSASHRESLRGRGLTLINGLADRVDTVRTPTGSRVTMHFDHAVT